MVRSWFHVFSYVILSCLCPLDILVLALPSTFLLCRRVSGSQEHSNFHLNNKEPSPFESIGMEMGTNGIEPWDGIVMKPFVIQTPYWKIHVWHYCSETIRKANDLMYVIVFYAHVKVGLYVICSNQLPSISLYHILFRPWNLEIVWIRILPVLHGFWR